MQCNWTVVTVTHNSKQDLEAFWLDFDRCVPWIVVDNASEDGSADFAETLGAEVVRLNRNVGFSRANNLGFAKANSKFVAFVNPDVRVNSESLVMMESIILERGCILAPHLVYPSGEKQPNGRGLPYLSHKLVSRVSKRSKVLSRYYQYAQTDEVLEVDWLMGAVVCGSSEDFRLLGPWDETFFVYYEDADLCLRAKSRGIRSFVIGSQVWTHRWDRATSKFTLKPWIREATSAARFYSRYPNLLIPRKRNG